jgi:hypothetical protein
MDPSKLDDLNRRASKVDASDKQKARERAKAVRDGCAETRKSLKEAEARIVELTPQANRVKTYVQRFRWDLIREYGMPEDVRNHLRELNASMTGGLNMIRETIRKIDEFSAEDIAGRWRSSNDVGSIVANAGVLEQMVGALKRDLEYWTPKLEQSLTLIDGGHEAREGTAPATGGDDQIRLISNLEMVH